MSLTLLIVASTALVVASALSVLRIALLPFAVLYAFLEALFGRSNSASVSELYGVSFFLPLGASAAGFSLAYAHHSSGFASPALAVAGLTTTTVLTAVGIGWDSLETRYSKHREARRKLAAAAAEAARQEERARQLAVPFRPGPLQWRPVPTFWTPTQVGRQDTPCFTVETNHLFQLTYLHDSRAGKTPRPRWALMDLSTGKSETHGEFPLEAIATLMAPTGYDPFSGLLEARQLEAGLEPAVAAADIYYGPSKTGWRQRINFLRGFEAAFLAACERATTATEQAVAAAQARAFLLRDLPTADPSPRSWPVPTAERPKLEPFAPTPPQS